MALLKKLNPRLSKDSRTYVGRKKRSYIENLYFDAINYSKNTRTKVHPRLRPSAFPMCSIRTWRKLVEGALTGTYPSTDTASGNFFCSVGTIAHEVFQMYMGEHQVVYGDWKCVNKECSKSKGKSLTRTATTNNKCPVCKTLMRYEELEIFYNGIYAHIDCLIKLPKSEGGGWWVLDYKTATKYAIETLTKPKVAHTYQVPAYVYMLSKAKNIKIKGYSLLYISRDNPFKFLSLEYEWDRHQEQTIKNRLKQEKRKFKSALVSLTTRDVQYIIDVKPCRSQADYDALEFYEECEFVDVCFNRPLLENRLLSIQNEFPYKIQQAKKLRKEIQLQEKPK